MNDLIRFSNQRQWFIDLISGSLANALQDAKALLREVGVVTSIEEYERSKDLIEQKLGLPTFEFESIQ